MTSKIVKQPPYQLHIPPRLQFIHTYGLFRICDGSSPVFLNDGQHLLCVLQLSANPSLNHSCSVIKNILQFQNEDQFKLSLIHHGLVYLSGVNRGLVADLINNTPRTSESLCLVAVSRLAVWASFVSISRLR